MKKLLLLAMALMVMTGCSLVAQTPYGNIDTDTDSQIFTYTDADVSVSPNGAIKSDDTTLIIVGVKDNTGADLDSIFNHAMTQIKEIFQARQKVYQQWVRGNDGIFNLEYK